VTAISKDDKEQGVLLHRLCAALRNSRPAAPSKKAA
jgi:hypothetical protein